MAGATDLLVGFRGMIKLHETLLKTVCEQYQLTLIEGIIISFLHNNPGKDTAADIVELRMLSKGNVSQAVESLIQKSYLRREQDTQDRRKIHLYLLPEAQSITEAVERMGEQFQQEMFAGITEEELEQLERINKKIRENTQNAMKRREER